MKYVLIVSGLFTAGSVFVDAMDPRMQAPRALAAAALDVDEDHDVAVAIQESLLEQERLALQRDFVVHHASAAHPAVDHQIPVFPVRNFYDEDEEAWLVAALAESLELAERKKQVPEKKEKVLPAFNLEEECPICASSFNELGVAQVRFTRCCNHVICKNDSDRLEREAAQLHRNMSDAAWRQEFSGREDFAGWPVTHEHANCPFCRAYPLDVVSPLS